MMSVVIRILVPSLRSWEPMSHKMNYKQINEESFPTISYKLLCVQTRQPSTSCFGHSQVRKNPDVSVKTGRKCGKGHVKANFWSFYERYCRVSPVRASETDHINTRSRNNHPVWSWLTLAALLIFKSPNQSTLGLNSLCTFTLLRHLIKANKRDNLLKVWVLLVGFPVTSRSGGRGNLKTLIDFSFRPVGRSPAAWEPTRRRRLAALPPPLPLVMPNCVLQHLFIIDGRHDGYGHNINVRLTQQRHESWPTLFQSRRFIGPPLKSDI